MSVPKCFFFQDLEVLIEVFGRMSAGISGQKLPLWAKFSFLIFGSDKNLSRLDLAPLRGKAAREAFQERHLRENIENWNGSFEVLWGVLARVPTEVSMKENISKSTFTSTLRSTPILSPRPRSSLL